MRSKKRVLVTAFGATVALTLQTPVSAFIVEARKAAVATAVTHHNPPSYLADAFTDAGRRVLQADRWNGWRADSALADDLDSAPAVHQTSVASTLGNLDLGDLGAGTAAQGRNSSIGSAAGDSATASASFVGGSGSGGGGGGIGGVGGGGGGGGAGGVGAGDESLGSLMAASAAGSNGFVAGGFGTLPGVSAGHMNSPFSAVPGVLTIVDPTNGVPINTPGPVAVESPEPGTLLFLGAGLAGLAARRVRRSRFGRG